MKIEINNHLSVGDFLEEFGISRKGVSQTTTWSVSFREEFVKKYFEAELNTYRWVHLREDVAKKMEEEKGLMGIFHEFLNE